MARWCSCEDLGCFFPCPDRSTPAGSRYFPAGVFFPRELRGGAPSTPPPPGALLIVRLLLQLEIYEAIKQYISEDRHIVWFSTISRRVFDEVGTCERHQIIKAYINFRTP